MKAFLREYWIELVLFLLGLVVAIGAFPFLPDQIPLQWKNGEVVTRGTKAFLFVFPVLLAVPFAIHGLLSVQMRLLPFLKGFDRLLAVLVGIVLLTCQVCVILLALGAPIRMEVVMLLELAAVPVILAVFVARKLLRKSS